MAKLSSVFINLWRVIPYLILTLSGGFICLAPFLATKIVLPTILASLTWSVALPLGLVIAIPFLFMAIAAFNRMFSKYLAGEILDNIGKVLMAMSVLTIGILLLVNPALPVVSVIAGMVNGFGVLGAIITKIALIAFGGLQLVKVRDDLSHGSYNRAMDGARVKDYLKNGVNRGFGYFWDNRWKILEKLAMVALAVFIACKISFAVGLIAAIPLAFVALSSVIKSFDYKQSQQCSKCIDNTIRILFGGALLSLGLSPFVAPILPFLIPVASIFTGGIFAGILGSIASISLAVFGGAFILNAITDIICGAKEKMRRGFIEMVSSGTDKCKNAAEAFDVKLKDNADGVDKVKGDVPEYVNFSFKTTRIK